MYLLCFYSISVGFLFGSFSGEVCIWLMYLVDVVYLCICSVFVVVLVCICVFGREVYLVDVVGGIRPILDT